MEVAGLLDSPLIFGVWWYSWRAGAILASLWALRFLYTGFKTRRRYRELAAQGIVCSPAHLPFCFHDESNLIHFNSRTADPSSLMAIRPSSHSGRLS